jgi:cyanophycinase
MTAKRQAQPGPLFIIGGAEDKKETCDILREFLRKSGGGKAKLAILTAATDYPEEVGETYTKIFERLGAAEVWPIHTLTRADAEAQDLIDQVAKATGIFFTGGDQAQLVEVIKDTALDQQVHQQHKAGIPIAGTSAGAAMMPDIMIIEGESETSPRPNIIETGPGLGFLPGIIIDQHFAQRGRLGRLITALMSEKSSLGLGIDEDTAIVVEGQEFEVIGSGAVTVVDETETTYNNMDQLLHDELLAVFGAKLHILPQGFRFNMTTRKPIHPNG